MNFRNFRYWSLFIGGIAGAILAFIVYSFYPTENVFIKALLLPLYAGQQLINFLRGGCVNIDCAWNFFIGGILSYVVLGVIIGFLAMKFFYKNK